MHRTLVVLIAAAALCMSAVVTRAEEAPGGTLQLSGKSAAAGVGFTWGDGTLAYKGKSYPVTVEGLTVGSVGITTVTASGKVSNLKNLKDFDGNYTALGAGATAAGGGGITAMRNQNGVTVDLVSTTEGASVTLGAGGVHMAIKQ